MSRVASAEFLASIAVARSIGFYVDLDGSEAFFSNLS